MSLASHDLERAPHPGRPTGQTAVCLVVAALIGTLGCATTQEVDSELPPLEEDVEVIEEPGFFGTNFPLWPEPELAAPVEDAKAWIYLLNLVPLGGLWGPLLLLDEEGRPDIGGDVVVPYLLPWLTGLAGGVCVTGPLTALGIVITSVVCIAPTGGIGFLLVPVTSCVCVGLPSCLSLVPAGLGLWVAPTSSINAWNRAYQTSPDATQEPGPGPAPPTNDVPAPPSDDSESPASRPATPAEPGQPAPEDTSQPPQIPAPAEPPAPTGRDVEVDDEGWVPY